MGTLEVAELGGSLQTRGPGMGSVWVLDTHRAPHGSSQSPAQAELVAAGAEQQGNNFKIKGERLKC